MYNNHFELVNDDLFLNILMDQPQYINDQSIRHGFPRINSNSNMILEFDPQQELLFPQPIQQQSNKKQSKKKKSDDTMIAKNNLKNTYINKITSLISENKQPITQQYERKASIYNEDSAQAKLIRNRECARNSRKRKKIYIELLENRVNFLNEELEKCKRIIKGQTSYLQHMGSDQLLQNFFVGRQQLFEKLEKAVASNSGEPEINLLLDSMRFRVGGGGKERVNASNYFCQQILDVCFPIHVKYMLWASGSDQNEPQWFKELSQEINLSDEQLQRIRKAQKKIAIDKDKLEDLIKQFQDSKDNLYNKTQQLENCIDEMRTVLTPIQIAKFLLALEKNKFQKELSIPNIWKIFDESYETEIKEEEQSNSQDNPQKKVQL